MRSRCTLCHGSGKQLGAGMLIQPCSVCVNGWIEEKNDEIVVLDKRSKSYKDAAKKIVALGFTKEEAEKELDKGKSNEVV